MATWTTLPDASLEPGKPIRSIDGLALRDNPVAITEGAVGAPKIQTEALITGERMNTANVLNATAGAAAGAVGTYAMATGGGTSAFGDTVAGSGLTNSGALRGWGGPGSAYQFAQANTGSALSGTWRCMGRAGGTVNAIEATFTTLWLRIS
jgi:hypothetical protein